MILASVRNCDRIMFPIYDLQTLLTASGRSAPIFFKGANHAMHYNLVEYAHRMNMQTNDGLRVRFSVQRRGTTKLSINVAIFFW